MRHRMIIESIITTMDSDGSINFAPMGVEWGEESIVIKPFIETATFRNGFRRTVSASQLVP